MQRLEVSGAVRPIYGSLGVKRLICGLRLRPLSKIVCLVPEIVLNHGFIIRFRAVACFSYIYQALF